MKPLATLVALAVITHPLAAQVEHVTDQFARCDIWLVFGVERTKQTTTEFVRLDYLSVSGPVGSSKPLGLLADVTLQFALADSMLSGQAFHPATADKKLVVKSYSPTRTDFPPRGDIEQSFFYALPSGTLQLLADGSAKMRTQGPERTCDAALDGRAQRAVKALQAAVDSARVH